MAYIIDSKATRLLNTITNLIKTIIIVILKLEFYCYKL